MNRIRRRIREHRDLGRPCFGVNADPAPEQPLRRDNVDVAWSGDQVDLATQARHTIGEHRDRRARRPRRPRPHRGCARARGYWGAAGRRTRSAAGASAMEGTPATFAGTTFMITLDASGANPAGTYKPTRLTGIMRRRTTAPGATLTSPPLSPSSVSQTRRRSIAVAKAFRRSGCSR